MKNGLASAGRALSHGLHPYRVDCRRQSAESLVVQVYHPEQALLLLKTNVTNADATNPFRLNAIVNGLNVQLNALAAYVDSVVLARTEAHCQIA